MSSKHGATATTQSHPNGHQTQTNETLQETQMPKTGKHIQCDLLKLREDPQKIERWLTQRNEPPDITKSTPAAEDWGEIKEPIQQALQTIYPKKDKHQKTNRQNGHKKPNNGAHKQNGENATTHNRTRQHAKTNNRDGKQNKVTEKQNHANPNNKCVETSHEVPQSQQRKIQYAKNPEPDPLNKEEKAQKTK